MKLALCEKKPQMGVKYFNFHSQNLNRGSLVIFHCAFLLSLYLKVVSHRISWEVGYVSKTISPYLGCYKSSSKHSLQPGLLGNATSLNQWHFSWYFWVPNLFFFPWCEVLCIFPLCLANSECQHPFSSSPHLYCFISINNKPSDVIQQKMTGTIKQSSLFHNN